MAWLPIHFTVLATANHYDGVARTQVHACVLLHVPPRIKSWKIKKATILGLAHSLFLKRQNLAEFELRGRIFYDIKIGVIVHRMES